MTTPEDVRLSALMRAVQTGDGRAYAELLKTIAPLLRRIVAKRRPFLQQADIEDLVQEILFSLHAVRRTYDPERPFMPWLIAIAHHRLADAARRYARRGSRETEFDPAVVTLLPDTTNMEADQYGDPEALKRAIEALPSRQRQAVEMLKLRQMSLKEAADASGMTVGALKVSVHRAIASLRAILKG